MESILSIRSREEQDFVSKWINKDLAIVNGSVWLSARRKIGRIFEWADGTPISGSEQTGFTNWAPESPTRTQGHDCVQMALGDGKYWGNVPCSNTSLVVCQKPQTSRFQRLKELRKTVTGLQVESSRTRTESIELSREGNQTKSDVKALTQALTNVVKELANVKNKMR